MQKRPRLPDTWGNDINSFTSYRAISDTLRQAKESTLRIGKTFTDIGRVVSTSSAEKRNSGYGSFVESLKQMQGKIGGGHGAVIDSHIANALSKIEKSGGANINGSVLSGIIRKLEANLRTEGRHVGGAEGRYLSDFTRGLFMARGQTINSGFKGIAGGQKDMVKAAFNMSKLDAVNDYISQLSTSFRNTVATLRDPGLRTALNHIKTGMDNAAAAANSTGDKLKALGNAKKDLERLIKTSSGLDKDTLKVLQMELKKVNVELKRAAAGHFMTKLGQAVAKPFVSFAHKIGQTASILSAVKRTFDVTNGIFQSVNSKVNKFAQLQMGITAERAGFGRQLRGAGINPREMIGALAAGRSAGMDDRVVVNQMSHLQTEMARARWGEGGMIDAAGRWGISTFNSDGSVRSANEMMIEFSRKLKTLGSDMEKLQFLTHLNFRPEQMEYVANYEKEAKRMEMLKANPHLQTVMDRANILDESGYSARVDKYTKLEQKRRQILNQNAIDEGVWPALKRSMNTENWLFNDWTARERGVQGANAEIANEKMQKTMEAMLAELKKNGGDKNGAISAALGSSSLTAQDLDSLVDQLKNDAKETGNPKLVTDFENAIKNMTGMTLETKTEWEELCETLNKTFESIVGWAEKAVAKLSEFFNFSPEAKKDTLDTFIQEEAKTAGIYATAQTANAGLQYFGSKAQAIGESTGSTAKNLGGRVMKGTGRAIGWLANAYLAYDTYKNWGKAQDAGRAKQAEIEVLKAQLSEGDAEQYSDGGLSELTISHGSVKKVSPEDVRHAPRVRGGGKASQVSVFGEAGPEYAIPVRHDNRTAELITRVAEESGFESPVGDIHRGRVIRQYADGGFSDEEEDLLNSLEHHYDNMTPEEIAAEHEAMQKRYEERQRKKQEQQEKQRRWDEDNKRIEAEFIAKEEERKRRIEESRARDRALAAEYRRQKETDPNFFKAAEEVKWYKPSQYLSKGDVKHIAKDFAATTVGAVGSGLTLGIVSSDDIRDSLTDEEFKKRDAELAEEHPTWNKIKHGSAAGVSMLTGTAAIGGAIKVAGRAKQAITGAKQFEDLNNSLQMVGNTAIRAERAAQSATTAGRAASTQAAARLKDITNARLTQQGVTLSANAGRATVGQKIVSMATGQTAKNLGVTAAVGGAATYKVGDMAVQDQIKRNAELESEAAELRRKIQEKKEKSKEERKKKEKAERVKKYEKLDETGFLNTVRTLISSNASEEQLQELFAAKKLRNVNTDIFRNDKKFMSEKNNKAGAKHLAGLYMQQQNIDASLLAGKNVNVQNEMKNLTDKYALAWKNAGMDFDDYQQQVNIAARQAGKSDATSFKEMVHYFEKGDQYQKDANQILAEMLTELKKDKANAGLSDEQLRQKAEEKRREKFLKDMSSEDIRNRFKYDENGKERTNEADIIKARDEAFSKEGVKVQTKQKFKSEQKKELEDFIASRPDQDLALTLHEFAVEKDMSDNDTTELLGYGTKFEDMDEKRQEQFKKTRAYHDEVKKRNAAGKKSDKAKRRGELADNASDEQIKEILDVGVGGEGTYKMYLKLREKVKAGEKLTENEQKEYDKQRERVGKHLDIGRGSGRRGERVRPRSTRYEDDDEKTRVMNAFYDNRVKLGNGGSGDLPASMRGDRLLEYRNSLRGRSSGGSQRRVSGRRLSLASFSLTGGKGISITGGKGLSSLTGGKGISITGSGRSGRSAYGSRGRGRRTEEPDAIYSMWRNQSGAQRAMASTPSKVNATERAAASGNVARASGYGTRGTTAGGGSANVNVQQQIRVVVNGNLDKDAANELGGSIETNAATKFNEVATQSIKSISTQ